MSGLVVEDCVGLERAIDSAVGFVALQVLQVSPTLPPSYRFVVRSLTLCVCVGTDFPAEKWNCDRPVYQESSRECTKQL